MQLWKCGRRKNYIENLLTLFRRMGARSALHVSGKADWKCRHSAEPIKTCRKGERLEAAATNYTTARKSGAVKLSNVYLFIQYRERTDGKWIQSGPETLARDPMLRSIFPLVSGR
jgi:hypothetical protein